MSHFRHIQQQFLAVKAFRRPNQEKFCDIDNLDEIKTILIDRDSHALKE